MKVSQKHFAMINASSRRRRLRMLAMADDGTTVDDVVVDPITITIDASNLQNATRLNSDGNYYGITFPGDYIGTRGAVDDLLVDARSTTSGAIDYAGTINIIINIPVGMDIGANTGGNYGTQTYGTHTYWGGAKYELRSAWDSEWHADLGAAFGQFLCDPSFVINLDTDEWEQSALEHLNITINNSGTAVGGGGPGGYGGGTSLPGAVKYFGGGGGGGGTGMHPVWGAGNTIIFQATSSTWGAGKPGNASEYGNYLGWGTDGVQGKQATTYVSTGAAGGARGSGSAQVGGVGRDGHAGGSVFHIKSNVEIATVGTTLNIVNKSGGVIRGGGGGGGGGYSSEGGSGGLFYFTGGSPPTEANPAGNPLSQAEFGHGRDGVAEVLAGNTAGNRPDYKGGWPGSVIWIDATTNLTVANTITNENVDGFEGGSTRNYVVVGWDGTWA